MKLYEIAEDYKVAEQMLMDSIDESTGEMNEFDLQLFESIENDLEEKIKNIVKMIKNIEGFSSAIRNEEDAMRKRRVSLEKKAERLKQFVKDSMIFANKEACSYPEFKVSLAKCPPSVLVTNQELIPQDFKKEEVSVSVDLKLLLSHVKANGVIEGCELVTDKKRLNIK